jgi:hypothetical protein
MCVKSHIYKIVPIALFPTVARNFSLLKDVRNGSEARLSLGSGIDRSGFELRNHFFLVSELGARVSAMVKVLCYKPAGCGFDSRWCHWNFSVT